MEEEFEIPVVYDNRQYHFEARLLQLGCYTHKIRVNVNGTGVLFEPDEERNYSAYIDPTNKGALEQTDIYLLREIALAIESIVQPIFFKVCFA
jgi:hypothetical protein